MENNNKLDLETFVRAYVDLRKINRKCNKIWEAAIDLFSEKDGDDYKAFLKNYKLFNGLPEPDSVIKELECMQNVRGTE